MADELMSNKLALDELVLLGLGSRENFYIQLKFINPAL